MNGQRVGVWFWTRTGTPGFRYDDGWQRSPDARPLSVSLPLPAGGGDLMGARVEHYFGNLHEINTATGLSMGCPDLGALALRQPLAPK